MSGQADTEIRGNSPAHPAICLNGLVLPSWEPEFDPRQISANSDDVPQMLDALQITGIMPAEVAVFGTIDKRGDGLNPVWMSKTSEAFLHRLLHVRKQIPAAQGVTMEADRLPQEAAETAPIGR